MKDPVVSASVRVDHIIPRDTVVCDVRMGSVFFEAVASGRKRFDIRKDDRPFHVGDLIRVYEWSERAKCPTGRDVVVRVRYSVSVAFLWKRLTFVLLGFEP